MKKHVAKIATVALSALLTVSAAVGMTACGGDARAKEAKVKIVFWGYGDPNEQAVFRTLCNEFNDLYRGDVFVDYQPQSSQNYAEAARGALSRTRATVDVLYVNDDTVKTYAADKLLAPLDEYIATSTEIKPDEMWSTSVNRYLYDVNTTTQDGPDAHYYGIPKDIGPTVIFYNETHFTEAGVKILSVEEEDLDTFNAGGKDSRGKTKTELGFPADYEVKPHGYFTDSNGQKWFNNQIPMSWDECRELSVLVQNKQRELRSKETNLYGFFTEWWFNYGWSVGGNCIQYVQDDDPAYNGGYWDFTLMDDTPNFIVPDGAEDYTVGETVYKAGEIISWQDKLVDPKASEKQVKQELIADAAAGKLGKLPSQRDAFVEFVRIGQPEATLVDEIGGQKLYGYGICPMPSSIDGDAGKTMAFREEKISMLVDGRWNVVDFRARIGDKPGDSKNKFEWDVAPLPQYKEYYKDGDTIPDGKEVGDIKVHGVKAGHSGSVALCINNRSKKKDAAWKFCEYIGGSKGQKAQAESGFAIPSQIELAYTDSFLQPGRNPQNSLAFIRAAEVEPAGDWWLLKDKLWIDPWAGPLNSNVRNGEMTLSQFQNTSGYKSTYNTLKEYTKK